MSGDTFKGTHSAFRWWWNVDEFEKITEADEEALTKAAEERINYYVPEGMIEGELVSSLYDEETDEETEVYGGFEVNN